MKERGKRERDKNHERPLQRVRKQMIQSGGEKEEARGSVWVRTAPYSAGGGVDGALEID